MGLHSPINFILTLTSVKIWFFVSHFVGARLEYFCTTFCNVYALFLGQFGWGKQKT
jgi:hypothetical protein